jgi:hypothetical protein
MATTTSMATAIDPGDQTTPVTMPTEINKPAFL